MRGLESGHVTVDQREAWKKTSPEGDRQTDKQQTDIATYTLNRPRGRFSEEEKKDTMYIE